MPSLQVLGKGAFGTVYAAKHRKTGQSYAVKSMEKSKLVSEVLLGRGCGTPLPQTGHRLKCTHLAGG